MPHFSARLFVILPLAIVAFAPRISHADLAAEWAKRETEVAAAKTPAEKARALLLHAGVPVLNKDEASRDDWKKAGKSLDEFFEIINKLSAANKTELLFNGTANNWRGQVAYELENYKGAINFYEQSEADGFLSHNAKSNDKGSALLFHRAKARAAIYDFSGALADLDKAVALKEKSWVKDRSKMRFESGDWDGAVADWQRAQQLGVVLPSEEAAPQYGSGALDKPIEDDDFLDQTFDNKPKPANKTDKQTLPFDRDLIPFNKAIAANSNNLAPFLARGQFQLDKAQKPEAARNKEKKIELLQAAHKDFTRAVQLDKKSALAYRKRAQVRGLYAHTNDTSLPITQADVLADFNQAIRLEPQNSETRYEIGQYFLQSRQHASRQPTEEQKTGRESELRSAIKNFSLAILFKGDVTGQAHFARARAERERPKPDTNAVFVDYDAFITASELLNNVTDALVEFEKQLADAATAKSLEKSLSSDTSATKEQLAEAHITRGKIRVSRGQYNEALKDFDKGLGFQSTNLDGLFERGKLRVLRGDYQGAFDDLKYVTRDRPRFAEGWLWRAAALDGKGEIENARAALQEGFKADPNLKARVKSTRYDEQNPTQNALAPAPQKTDKKIVPTGTALERKNAGNALNEKGDKDGALAEYTNAILIDPNFADAYTNRGNIYLGRAQYDLALADLNRAIEIDPKHRVAYINRALLWDDLGQVEKQGADLDRAIEFADNPARKTTAYLTRAKLRFAAKDQNGAQSDMKLAKEQAGADSASWSQIGIAHLGWEQLAEAIVAFRRALEIKPDSTSDRLLLAATLQVQNDPAAEEEMQKAKNAPPEEIKQAQDYVLKLLKKPGSNANNPQ